LRPTNGCGPWPFFEAANEPKVGSRIFGYVKATCPDCAHDRYYWIYTDYGKSGWYAELPANEFPNSKFLGSLLAKTEREQQTIIYGLATSTRVQIASP
jgi:hypothetical protein